MSILRRVQPGDSNPPAKPGSGTTSFTSPTMKKLSTAGITTSQETYQDLKNRVQTKLLAGLDPSMDVTKTAEVRKTIQELFEQILTEENIVLSRAERARLFEQISAEILGYGPLQPLLDEEDDLEAPPGDGVAPNLPLEVRDPGVGLLKLGQVGVGGLFRGG